MWEVGVEGYVQGGVGEGRWHSAKSQAGLLETPVCNLTFLKPKAQEVGTVLPSPSALFPKQVRALPVPLFVYKDLARASPNTGTKLSGEAPRFLQVLLDRARIGNGSRDTAPWDTTLVEFHPTLPHPFCVPTFQAAATAPKPLLFLTCLPDHRTWRDTDIPGRRTGAGKTMDSKQIPTS